MAKRGRRALLLRPKHHRRSSCFRLACPRCGGRVRLEALTTAEAVERAELHAAEHGDVIRWRR